MPTMNARFLSLLILISFVGTSGPISAAADPKDANVARVAVLKYQDKTGTKNFEYMPASLKEAIGGSMHEKFEFVEADIGKVEAAAAAVRAQNKGIIGPKEAAEICRRADIDILIYGNFTYDESAKLININTMISLGSADKFRSLKPTDNRVDATIFQAADKVATDIVGEITRVAKEQQEAKGQVANKEKGKTQLQKIEKPIRWADSNWMFSAGAGAVYPLVSQANAKPKTEPTLSFHASRRVYGPWYAGVYGNYGGIRTQSSSSVTSYEANLDVAAAALFGGYYWDISNRWRLNGILGGGYYYGKFNRYSNCESTCSGTSSGESFIVKNPFLVARGGGHFLIFSFLSVGIEAEYRMYYDTKPVSAVSGSLMISGVF
jgi:hypothetical protein